MLKLASLLLLIQAAIAQVKIPEKKTISLNGEWNLVLNEYLTYDQVQDDTTAITTQIPGTWNNIIWNNEEFSGKGYGTYFKKIQLSNHSDDVTLFVPAIGLAYRVFVNDVLIGSIGTPGKSNESSKPKLKPSIFRIPNDLKGKEVTIIFHVANFWHQNGGLWFAPEVGNADVFRLNKLRSIILNILVLGSILIIKLYHLYMFILRPKEKYSLYFFLICTCLLAQSLSNGDMTIVHIFPSTGWKFILKMDYISLFMVAALNALFIQSLYPTLTSRLFVKALTSLSIVTSLFTLLAPTSLSYYLIVPMQFITVITGLYLLVVMTKAVRREMVGAQTLIVGFSIAFITALNDILLSHYLIDSIPIVQFGVFGYVLTLSIVLAQYFVDSIKAKEKLSLQLQSLNLDLENRVKERTSELEIQKELVAKQNEKLSYSNKELKQLMAVVAHDLKSPLSNIYSLSGVLEDKLNSEHAKWNQMIRKVAASGLSLIDDILKLKSYEQEDMVIKKQPVDLSAFLNSKYKEFSHKAAEKDIIITTNIQDGIVLRSSEQLLSQIIDNLLSNAVKFSPAGTKINLKLSEEKEVLISIKDEGPGFTDKDMEKVFNKFQPLSARPTGGETSSGLGLFIVKTLVQKLGGEINLESEAGKGAKFIITFPKY